MKNRFFILLTLMLLCMNYGLWFEPETPPCYSVDKFFITANITNGTALRQVPVWNGSVWIGENNIDDFHTINLTVETIRSFLTIEEFVYNIVGIGNLYVQMISGQTTDVAGFNEPIIAIENGLFILGKSGDTVYGGYPITGVFIGDINNSQNFYDMGYNIANNLVSFLTGPTVRRYTFDKSVGITGWVNATDSYISNNIYAGNNIEATQDVIAGDELIGNSLDVNDAYIDGYCNATGCFTLAQLLNNTVSIDTNCSLTNSCPTIAYQGQNVTFDNVQVDNLTVENNAHIKNNLSVTQHWRVYYKDGILYDEVY